ASTLLDKSLMDSGMEYADGLKYYPTQARDHHHSAIAA
ncbi:hypothetical protein NPIL_591061, partial [Nephila pilipes]